MKKVIHYDEDYCCKLIKSALSANDSNEEINRSSIKKHILSKVEYIKERYSVDHEDIYSEICFDFIRKSVITKIRSEKGCPTTFILHYVFNQLRDIEKSCARGTYGKMHRNCDAMDRIAFHLEDLQDEGEWIPELWDHDDPESLLIAKETLQRLITIIGEREVAVLFGELSMEEYLSITGISERSFFYRISRGKQLFEVIMESDSD
jgi:hypothetical protein